ncbi:ECHDC3 family protein [Megaselia abdita]
MLRQITSLGSKSFGRNFHSTSFLSQKLTTVKEVDGVREIQLNDSKTRNSLSMPMMEDILTDLTKDIHNESLRCIVLTSTGPVWSAGHNLKELTDDKSDGHKEVFAKLSEIIMQMYKSPVPIIAKVDGLAAAAGCQLVASCDMVVCSDKSAFSTPGANFGIFCSSPGVAIGRVMPRMKSSYMLFTGLPINANEAYTSGLVTSVVPSEQLDAEVNKICDAIKHKSRAVIKHGKEFYYKQLSMNIKDAYDQAADVMASNLQLKDGKEGIKSFVEKRKPKWNHE